MIISFNDDIDGWLCLTTRILYCERVVDDGTLGTGIALLNFSMRRSRNVPCPSLLGID
jgi:hypothetical protein